MFVVMGATGKVGGAAANQLLAARQPVRVVVRSTAKGAAWAARGCDVAVADTGDTPALVAAFRNAEAVFAMLPPAFDPSPGFPEAKAMIDSLHEALTISEPYRAVILSTVGAQATQTSLLSQLGLLEQALADLPYPTAFLRAAWFMDNAAWDVEAAAATGKIGSYLQPTDRAIPMVAAADVGFAVAQLMREHWVGHRIVELEGRQRLAPNDIATALGQALGREVQAYPIDRQGWEAAFRLQGMRNPTPRLQMLEGFNQGWLDFARGSTEARQGERRWLR